MFYFPQKILHQIVLLFLISSLLATPVRANFPLERGNLPAVTDGQLATPRVPTFAGCDPTVFPSQNLEYERTLVELVNAERSEAGVPPLKRISLLDEAARYHTTDLAQDNYFAHDTFDRVDNDLEWVCSWSDRIRGFYPSGSWLGENIAAGAATPQAAMELWMNSPGHRENILHPEFWEIGVGVYSGSGDYFHYWAQDFGRRAGFFPLVIEGERAITDETLVDLYIYGDWNEVRLHADQESWSAWMPFQNSLSWNLPATPGEHSIYAEMRTSSLTGVANDSIFLDLPAQDRLGNLPDQLHFTYSTASKQLLPAFVLVTPLNMGSPTILEWQVDSGDDWILATPEQGETPQSLQVTLLGLDSVKIGIYTSTLEIEVTSPLDTLDSPHAIAVTLQVVDEPLHSLYLPNLSRFVP